MTDEVRVVEEDVQVEAVPLEPGLCQATKVIRRLKELGFWKRLRSSVHLRRRAGSYEALDLVLFLVAYFASGSGKAFSRATTLGFGDGTGAANAAWNMTAYSFTQESAPIPEPNTMLLLAAGLLGLAGVRRRQHEK